MNDILRNSWFHPRYLNKRYSYQILSSIKHYAKGRMVDIGCGLRPYQLLFKDGVTSYIGIDWPASVEKARPDIISDALSLPILHDKADTVLATELIEHLPDPDQFIAEVARILRINGALILSVPFLEPLHEEPRDYYRLTPHGLRVILERHGFSLVHLSPKGGLPAVLGSFISQSVYELLNPLDKHGKRKNHILGLLIALPLCFIVQGLFYLLDILSKETKYTMGYITVATLNHKIN
jgi:SAM-dependent methyltransferase